MRKPSMIVEAGLKKLDGHLFARSVIHKGKMEWEIVRKTVEGELIAFRWEHPHLSLSVVAELQIRDTYRNFRRKEYAIQNVFDRREASDNLGKKRSAEAAQEVREQFMGERGADLIENLHYLRRNKINVI